jgi:hypothetical protein
MIGDQQFDAFADDRATEFIDRHASGKYCARTKVVGVWSGHIGQDANAYGIAARSCAGSHQHECQREAD